MTEEYSEKVLSISVSDAELERNWLFSFLNAISSLSLYPTSHPRAKAAVMDFHTATRTLQDHAYGEVTLTCSKDSALINHFTIDESVKAFERIGQDLRARNIHTLVFSKEVTPADLSVFSHIFAMPTERIISSGGIELLLQESGVTAIKLAKLKYSHAVEDDKLPDNLREALEKEEDRILFARMDEALESENSSLDVAALLENPKLTAKFLESKATPGDNDLDYADKVANTLQRAGVLAYHTRSEHWPQVREKLSEALMQLNPQLRGKVLESAQYLNVDNIDVLDEIISSLRPEQLAMLIVDYIEEIERMGNLAADVRTREKPSGEKEVPETVRNLIKSPDQFEVLAPILGHEFRERGEDLLSKAKYFGPLCEKYFQRIQNSPSSSTLAASSDKLVIHKNIVPLDEDQLENINDLLETVEPQVVQNSTRYLANTVLKQEDTPAVYKEMIGPMVLDHAKKALEDENLDEARQCYDIFIEHATMPEGQPFKERAEYACEFINNLDAAELVYVYLPDIDALNDPEKTEICCRYIDDLLSVNNENITFEILITTIDIALDKNPSIALVEVLSRHWDTLSNPLLKWFQIGNNPNSQTVRMVLQSARNDDALPPLRYLMHHPDPLVSGNAIRLIAKIDTPEADQTLFRECYSDTPIAQKAYEALRSKRSSQAVPLLSRDLTQRHIFSFQYKIRLDAMHDLLAINHVSARRELEKFALSSFPVLGRKELRGMVIELLNSLDVWPPKEAAAFLNKMKKHKDKRIAEYAQMLSEEKEEKS